MKKKINLFNHCHNGDIFFSRILINLLKDYYDITYYHNLNTPLLIDLDFVNEKKGIPNNLHLHQNYIEAGFINTWIGQNNMIYVRKIDDGFSLKNYMVLINELLSKLNVPIKNVEEILPFVNYDKLPNYEKIKNIFYELTKKYKKLILISNGRVESNQSYNFNFTPIIDNLALKNPDILFLLTEKTNLNRDNIIFTCDITQTKPDLLDISYISTFCNLIVGRSSGPYTYSLNKDNLLNKDKTFISFNYKEIESSLFNKEFVKCKFIWSNNFDSNNIINIINENI
jgi:hypothetical protein